MTEIPSKSLPNENIPGTAEYNRKVAREAYEKYKEAKATGDIRTANIHLGVYRGAQKRAKAIEAEIEYRKRQEEWNKIRGESILKSKIPLAETKVIYKSPNVLFSINQKPTFEDKLQKKLSRV